MNLKEAMALIASKPPVDCFPESNEYLELTDEERAEAETRCTYYTYPDPRGNPFYGGAIQREMHKDPEIHAKIVEPFSRPKTDEWKEKAKQWQTESWVKDRDKRVRKVFAEGVVYKDAFEAAEFYGIHPVNIRRKCRLKKEGYRYV